MRGAYSTGCRTKRTPNLENHFAQRQKPGAKVSPIGSHICRTQGNCPEMGRIDFMVECATLGSRECARSDPQTDVDMA